MTTFRSDRLATLSVVRPIRRLLSRSSRSYPSILMYHRVTDSAPMPDGHPYFEISTSVSRFRQQMDLVEEYGMKVIPLSTLLSAPSESCERSVALTFDDGYRDFMRNAFPVLAEKHFPSTVFLPTELIGTDHAGECYLRWDEVGTLSNAGVEFGSHSASHGMLRRFSDPMISREIGESKEAIERRLGRKVDAFSFPYAFPQEDGAFKARLGRILSEHGIKYCLTTVVGRHRKSPSSLFFNRIPVNEYDDKELFLAKLNGDYDWVRWFQFGSRALSRIVRHKDAP